MGCHGGMEKASTVDYHGLTEWTVMEFGGNLYAVPERIPEASDAPWTCEHCDAKNGAWVASCSGCGLGWKGREIMIRWTDFQFFFPDEFVEAHDGSAHCTSCGRWTPPDWPFCAHCKAEKSR